MKANHFIVLLFLIGIASFLWTENTPKLAPIFEEKQTIIPLPPKLINPFEKKDVEFNFGFLGKNLFQTGLYHEKHTPYGEFFYYIPHQTNFSKPIGCILALHGINQTAHQYLSLWTRSAFQSNYILICPQSEIPGGRWHIQDTQRILNLLESFEKIYPIDSNQILLAGFSEGAHFAYYLGINHPTRFSAIATVCGKIRNAWEGQIFFQQDPRYQIPIFSINGKQDKIVWTEEAHATWQKLEDFNYPISTWMINHLSHEHDPSLNTSIMHWFHQLQIKES